jgi:hypothetical protein
MKLKLMSALTSAILLSLFMAGCQQEELTAPNGIISTRNHDCETTCIDPDAPIYQEHSDFVMETAGPNYRKFDYTLYNTLTGVELVWSYSASQPTPRRLTFELTGDGFTVPVSFTTGCNAPPQNGSHSFVFNDTWEACDIVSFTAKIEDCAGLLKASQVGQYNLVGECISCDEDSTFTYETANENLDVIFSYNAGSFSGPLTDAVVAFTFPQIMDFPLNEDGQYVAPDGKLYTVNNPTNQTVFTWTGDIGCTIETATTFAFSLVADCSAPPANDGKANIWADTEVNGVSVKNSNTPNIVYSGCQ